MSKSREAQQRANKKWQDKALRPFILKFSKRDDADIISAIESSDNMTGFVRDAVRLKIASTRASNTRNGDSPSRPDEYKMGDIFTLPDGTLVRCVGQLADGDNDCKDCVFESDMDGCGKHRLCSKPFRTDGMDVIFLADGKESGK